MTSKSTDDAPPPRWPFIRDVLVFQLKLVLGNLQNFALVPVSVIAALFDLVAGRRDRHGRHFYKVLEIGREIDEAIDVYSAIGGYRPNVASSESSHSAETGMAVGEGWRSTTVDGVVRRVEDVIKREFQKGGTAASVKAAVDRVLDELQRESKKK